jgi:hypothetical protein
MATITVKGSADLGEADAVLVHGAGGLAQALGDGRRGRKAARHVQPHGAGAGSLGNHVGEESLDRGTLLQHVSKLDTQPCPYTCTHTYTHTHTHTHTHTEAHRSEPHLHDGLELGDILGLLGAVGGGDLVAQNGEGDVARVDGVIVGVGQLGSLWCGVRGALVVGQGLRAERLRVSCTRLTKRFENHR